MVGEGLCEVVGGADEEVVAHDIPDHLLVEVAVVRVLPVCVLQHTSGDRGLNSHKVAHSFVMHEVQPH